MKDGTPIFLDDERIGWMLGKVVYIFTRDERFLVIDGDHCFSCHVTAPTDWDGKEIKELKRMIANFKRTRHYLEWKRMKK